jgi:hypothetical protein
LEGVAVVDLLHLPTSQHPYGISNAFSRQKRLSPLGGSIWDRR